MNIFGRPLVVFRFMRDGKPRYLGLGSANTVRLAAARGLAGQTRQQLQNGVDPIEARKQAVVAARATTAKSVPFKESIAFRSARTIEILKELEALRLNGFVFPGLKLGRHLSDMSLLTLLRRMDQDEITVHGFRSTFLDSAAETTSFPNHVVEMALAHTVANQVESAYRRGDLFEKRRKLMTAWERYCLGKTKAVPLGSDREKESALSHAMRASTIAQRDEYL